MNERADATEQWQRANIWSGVLYRTQASRNINVKEIKTVEMYRMMWYFCFITFNVDILVFDVPFGSWGKKNKF